MLLGMKKAGGAFPLPVFVILIDNTNSKPYYSQSQEKFSLFEKIFFKGFGLVFTGFFDSPGRKVKKIFRAPPRPLWKALIRGCSLSACLSTHDWLHVQWKTKIATERRFPRWRCQFDSKHRDVGTAGFPSPATDSWLSDFTSAIGPIGRMLIFWYQFVSSLPLL